MGKRDPNKRELLQLAGRFNREKHDPVGMYMSEKLDGMRCLWDGGVSRGLTAGEVPWANCAKGGEDHECTGLWSRGGKVIHCPDWFVEELPEDMLLDGELWGRGLGLQDITSICRAHKKDEPWRGLSFVVFDSPSVKEFGRTGRIHIRDWETQLPDMTGWFESHGLEFNEGIAFRDFVTEIEGVDLGPYAYALPQVVCTSQKILDEYLEEVVMRGGEGVMLRTPDSVWIPRRVRQDLMKVKKFYDAECEVIGLTFGKDTDKGGRLRGMMGTLRVREVGNGNNEFEIGGGFTDELRTLTAPKQRGTLEKKKAFAKGQAFSSPGKDAPIDIEALHFPRGTIFTFKYWDRTKDGVPKFAQYWRDRPSE